MDFTLLTEQRDGLEQELVTLKGDPDVEVPSVLKLVELEITRLNEILQSMGPDDTHDEDEDGPRMIDPVINEFALTEDTSVELFNNVVMDELQSIILTFRPPLYGIAILTLTVVQRLEKELLIDMMDMISNVGASTSQEQEQEPEREREPMPKPGSVDESGQVPSEGQGSSSSLQPDDTFLHKNLEWCISNVIDTTMRTNPQDLWVDKVIAILRQIAMRIITNEEDVRRCVFQKCEEAIESHKKKSAQGDEGESGSKQD